MSGGSAFHVGAVLIVAALAAAATAESVDRTTRAALSLDAHPAIGAAAFGHLCARCHGAHAHGDAARAIPALAGQRFNYLVRQLANFAGQQRDDATMHRVISRTELRDPQTWVDIAAYLNKAPTAERMQTGEGTHAALGRGIYHEQCASCHRSDARGDDDGFVPSLRNQHYSYLAKQMRQLADGDRHNVDENLVRFLRSFDPVDIDAVADYLSRLHGPGKNPKNMRLDGGVPD